MNGSPSQRLDLPAIRRRLDFAQAPDWGIPASMTGSGATPPDANARALMGMFARAGFPRSEA